jgi:hypothetical protein
MTEIQTRDAIKAVCDYAGITQDDLCMPRRNGCKVTWRRISAYILYDHCGATQQYIANSLGYAKHENAKHHIEKLRFWLENPDLAPRDEIIATRNIMFKLGL